MFHWETCFIFKPGATTAASKFCDWVHIVTVVFILHCRNLVGLSLGFSAAGATVIGQRNYSSFVSLE